MLLLRTNLIILLRSPCPLPASSLSTLHRLFSTTTSPTHFSIEDYLVTTCHLTPAQALKASKKLSHLKSPSKPNAVVAFLSDLGLSRSDIAAIAVADPLLLRSKVEKTLAPRVAVLRGHGFSDPQIARFLSVGAAALRSCDVAPKLDFWIPFFGSIDKLLQAMKSNNSILSANLDKVVRPNIEQLRQCGLSVCDIAQICLPASRMLISRPERMKSFVRRAEKLGVPHSSGMFKHAVATVASIKEEIVATRLEFLKRALGPSKTEWCIAVCKLPTLLRISEEKLRPKMEFLVTEVGLKLEYIIHRPALLTYSLELRLVPRYYVMKVLQAKGLLKKAICFYSAAVLSEKVFVSKYIDRHKESVPGLADAYSAAQTGELPSEVLL